MYSRTKQDSGAKALVKELVEEELEHSQWIENFKKGLERRCWHQEKVLNLMISEYIAGGDTLKGAVRQGTPAFAV